VAVIDREALEGYRFVGRPEVFGEGEPFERAKRATNRPSSRCSCTSKTSTPSPPAPPRRGKRLVRP